MKYSNAAWPSTKTLSTMYGGADFQPESLESTCMKNPRFDGPCSCLIAGQSASSKKQSKPAGGSWLPKCSITLHAMDSRCFLSDSSVDLTITVGCTLLIRDVRQIRRAVLEPRELPQEPQRHGADRAVTLLGDDEVGEPL